MEQQPFSALTLSPELLTVLEELGLKTMTPIQSQSIPVLLAGKDLIGQSQTGSGKTAAFVLPILNQIDLKLKSLQAVILCPTRELAAQVLTEVRKLGRRHEGLQVIALTGGQPTREQAQALENGVQIAVGTPGRILDLVNRDRIDFNSVKTLVLDEADKMFDMGFAAEIKAVIKEIPQTRQTVFFSATFPESVLDLSRRYQKNPVRVVIESAPESLQIEEIAYETEDSQKTNTLIRVLQQHQAESCLIFCNTKAAVAELTEGFSQGKVTVASLHGDLEQRDRDRVMAMFKNGSYRILIATDVAARGLDIDNLELVINYDFPLQPETYVHRIGRTGRAGKSGVAVTLIHPEDTLKLLEIENLTNRKFQKPSLGFKNQFGLNPEWRETLMQTLWISGGRKDKIRAGDILGALTGTAGLKSSSIGKIEVHDKHSFVAISASHTKTAFDRLRDGKIKGQKFQVRILK
ncbi:MAG: ATP-dependent RNA helicase DbpA [Bdellovibrio sp.]|nr:ATP-dependent RNA helicase DbpA [Bdellovibrio sp.]